MKTADMLAKYLNEWPLKYSRIVQADDHIFYGVFAGNEMHYEVIPANDWPGYRLVKIMGLALQVMTGLQPSGLKWKKVMFLIFLALTSIKKKVMMITCANTYTA